MVFRLALAQITARVGDIEGNAARVRAAWHAAAEAGADLVVFGELAITGYPPQDLLLKPELVTANLEALEQLAQQSPPGTVALVGYAGAADPARGADAAPASGAPTPPTLTNAAAVLAEGVVAATYAKMQLPDYGVFDESRYFIAGDDPLVVGVAGVAVGITVCEDVWVDNGPVRASVEAGARVIASLNASPYHRGKYDERREVLARHATREGVHLAYSNIVGGQDEVVFDGDSLVIAPDGEVVARAGQFVDDLLLVDLEVPDTPLPAGVLDLAGRDRGGTPPAALPARPLPHPHPTAEVWDALVRATGDYCRGNGFTEVIVGLSGGIDSAVVAALAADALGGDRVVGVAMPSPYSSQHSLDDAAALAANLGCQYHTIAITGPLRAMDRALEELVVTDFDRDDGREPGTAYENLQARLRGAILMTLSNELGGIVLTTGNKSELAVGYSTLHGDMAGGFAPLKDIPKTLVYELARWRNRDGAVIPTSTIIKPPSAELRPGQVDADSLPDYDTLDDIIAAYVEQNLEVEAIVARGHDRGHVERVIRLIDGAEHKRRQAAPGPKITARAFGRDRRLPITNLWGR